MRERGKREIDYIIHNLSLSSTFFLQRSTNVLVSRSQTNKIRSLFLFVINDDLLICTNVQQLDKIKGFGGFTVRVFIQVVFFQVLSSAPVKFIRLLRPEA